MLFLAFWNIPWKIKTTNALVERFKHWVVYFGFDNFWSLFAPNPPTKNFRISFIVELKNGTRKAIQIPEFKVKNNQQFITKVRFLKLFNLLLVLKDVGALQGMCRYILRNYQETSAEAVDVRAVHIIRYFEPSVNLNELGLPWLSETIYTYENRTNPPESLQ